jgi:hypothetical protein
MAYISYDDATFPFPAVSDIKGMMSGIKQIIQHPDQSTDAFIQSKIALAKNYIKRHDLLPYVKRVYPNTVNDFMRKILFRRDQNLGSIGEANAGTNGITPPSGMMMGSTDQFYMPFGVIDHPFVFFTNTPVSSSIGAGTAVNGDFAVDTTLLRMYGNQSVTTTPSWVQMLNENLINYIDNPACLFDAGISCTMWYLLLDASIWTGTSYAAMQGVYKESEKDWLKKYDRDVKNALAEMDISFSNSGIVNDYERAQRGNEEWLFV